MARAVEKAATAGAVVNMPCAKVTAGKLGAEVAFVRGPDGEKIEPIRFL
jgi:hypothetical protein